MPTFSIYQKVVVFSLFILAGTLLMGFAVYVSNQKMLDSEQWVQHAEQVIQQSGDILSMGKDIETSARGYIITGDSTYLYPLYAAQKTVFLSIAQLRRLTLGNGAMHKPVEMLNVYMHKRLDFSLHVAELRKTKGLAVAIAEISTNRGKHYTDTIRQVVSSIQLQETTLLAHRNKANQSSVAMFNALAVIAFIIMLGFAVLAIVVIRGYLLQNGESEKRAAELIIANKELAYQNGEKEKRAAELLIANEELGFQNKEKGNRAAELVIANKELEYQSKEKGKRAAELLIANEELIYQNVQKEKRAAELVIANEELVFQNEEKEKAAYERILSESRLEKSQQVAHMGNWELDFATNTIVLSAEACRIAGLDVTNTKHNFADCVAYLHPDDREMVVKMIKKSYNESSDISFDHRIIRSDGTVRYIRSVSKFEQSENNDVTSLYGIAYDVTDKKVAEEQLAFDKKNLDALINNTNDLMWSVDKNFKLITSNKVFEKVIMEQSGEWINKGNDVREIALDFAIVERHKGYYERAFAGEAFTAIEYSNIVKENWLAMSFYPIYLDSEIIGTACHAHDITESKMAEKEIASSAARLNEAQAIAHLGSWQMDFADNVLSLSDEGCRIFGFTPDCNRLTFETWTSLVHPGDIKRILESIQDAQSTLRDNSYSHRIVLNGGEVRHVFSESKFKFDLSGKAIGMFGTMQDVTDRTKAELEIKNLNENLEKRIGERTAELTEANKALEAFSYSVSHDLRAPVRTVMGFSKMLARDYEATMPAGAMELLDHIESSSKRMNAIIDDLLMLAKHSKEPVKTGNVDMNRLFRDVWDKISFASPHKAKLMAAILPTVRGDISMLEQVIVNMVSNAIKYSSKKDHPLVEVGFENADGNMIFFVKDNGAGFDMKHYDKLFGAFQRLHGMSEFEGTGVGLLLVKRIIERHGGSVWGEGKVDEGATFYFSLPAA